MFHLYDCKVRLQGNVLNEVPRAGLTAPEIEVLRMWHGDDAVVDIVDTGKTVKRDSSEERQRLYAIYAGNGLSGQAEKKKARIREVFGHDRLPLPETLEGVAPAAEEDEDPPAPPIKRTRLAPRPEAALE